MLTTRKEWELAIIRCAERWPERVGLHGQCRDHATGEFCIYGMILNETGTRGDHDGCADDLLGDAIRLNDAGTPWGLIPKQLGLVPGEAPASPVPTCHVGEQESTNDAKECIAT